MATLFRGGRDLDVEQPTVSTFLSFREVVVKAGGMALFLSMPEARALLNDLTAAIAVVDARDRADLS